VSLSDYEDDITTSVTPDESMKDYAKQSIINLSGLTQDQVGD